MLTSIQLQSEIEEAEAALQPTVAELDTLYTRFSRDIEPSVEVWMKEYVRRRVEENAAKVNSGGVEPLRKIKADLNSLIAQIPGLCKKALGEMDQWPHRRPILAGGYYSSYSSESGESYALTVFRKAINPLGQLLFKHGLLVEKSGSYSEWDRAGQGQFKYRFNPGFREQDFSVLQEYQEKRNRQVKQVSELMMKRAALEKAQARELWDEA